MGRPFPAAERALALDTSVLAPLAAGAHSGQRPYFRCGRKILNDRDR